LSFVSISERRGDCFLELCQHRTGAPFDQERNKIAYWAALELCAHRLNDERNLVGPNMGVLVGQPALDLGEQKLLTHLGHDRSLLQKRPTVNP